jgi:hypothetical protein
MFINDIFKKKLNEGGFDIPEIPRAPTPKPPKEKDVSEAGGILDILDVPEKVLRTAQDAARGMPTGTVPDSKDDLVNTATKVGKQVIDTARDAARGMPTGTVPKPQKDKGVDEQAPPLNVPQGWEAKTQADGSTRISKIGSMSSADYKQNMANYKAQNWTPEKMADYGQRMASGQGYTDAERAANYQQQQKSFGQYADQPVQEGSSQQFDMNLAKILKQRGYKGPVKLEQLGMKWVEAIGDIVDIDDLIMVQGNDPEYDGWVSYVFGLGKYAYGAEQGYTTGTAKRVEVDTKDEQGVAETALNPKDPQGDYDAKRKVIHDLSLDPNVDQQAVQQRRLDLDREAKAKGLKEQGVAEGDTLDTGPDGKLTAKGEEQMRRYRQQKREQERQQIIAKHTKTVKGDTYGVAPSRISQSRNEVNWAAANKELRKKGLDEQGVAEGSIQDKLHRRHQELRKKSGLPNPDYYKELRATYDLPDQERYAKAAELKKKYQVKEARKPEVNFDVEDLKKLERIRDLPTLKTLAFELISKPSAKPMKPEKVEWFRAALERMDSPLKVIKLMYDLLLSGEGHAVIGSKNSMKANTYRDRFGEATSDGSVKYEFDLGNGKKDYQISRPDKAGEKAPVDPKSAATIYQLNHPLRKIKSVRVVDKPKEEKSQVTNEDVERYIEELERAGYNILEEKTRLDPKCWKGYRKAGTKMKGDVRVNNCVPIKKKVDEYGAANGPPNLNKSDIKRMMPPEPVAEQIPTISDLNPREQPHPADQALGALRTIKRLAGIDKHDVENAVNQEITNVVRSPHDPSSKNVSIINRLFGRD